MSTDGINQRAVGELRESATDMRLKFIRDTYDLTKGLLEEQDESHDTLAAAGYQEGSVFVFWVLEDDATMPFKDGRPQKSLTTKLIPNESGHRIASGEYLELFLPVPDDFVLSEHSDTSLVDVTDWVGVHRVTSTGAEAWMIVDEYGVTPFIPEIESGEESRATDFYGDDIEDEMISRSLNLRADTGISSIGILREDFVNYSRVAQRYLTIMDGELVTLPN